jgi:hypothetical protein
MLRLHVNGGLGHVLCYVHVRRSGVEGKLAVQVCTYRCAACVSTDESTINASSLRGPDGLPLVD